VCSNKKVVYLIARTSSFSTTAVHRIVLLGCNITQIPQRQWKIVKMDVANSLGNSKVWFG